MKNEKLSKKGEWTTTADVNTALAGLISCIQYGYNAWIEVQKNGKQERPVMKKNPALDNPFNWTSSCGTLRKSKTGKENYFNDTEKDLAFNWIECYGVPEAVEAYQKTGEIKEGLICLATDKYFSPVTTPIKREDAAYYRKHIVGDDCDYALWEHIWVPKKGIPYYVLDDSIDEVLVICYDTEPVDMETAIRKTGEFLIHYANELALEKGKRSES